MFAQEWMYQSGIPSSISGSALLECMQFKLITIVTTVTSFFHVHIDVPEEENSNIKDAVIQVRREVFEGIKAAAMNVIIALPSQEWSAFKMMTTTKLYLIQLSSSKSVLEMCAYSAFN